MKLEEKIQMLSEEHEKIEKEIKGLYNLFDTREAYERKLVAETLQIDYSSQPQKGSNKEEELSKDELETMAMILFMLDRSQGKRELQEEEKKLVSLTEKEKEIVSMKIKYYELSKEDKEARKKFEEQLPEDLRKELYQTNGLIELKVRIALKESLGHNKDQLLLAAEYLAKAGILYGSCGGGSLGRFKRPTSCENCHRAEMTIQRLGLEEKLAFLGEREYEIPKETFESAYQKVISSDPEIKKIIETIHYKEEKKAMLEHQLEQLKKKARVYMLLIKKGYDPEKVDEVMPEAIHYILRAMKRSRHTVEDIKLDLSTKTLAIMSDYWYYSGSGGTEYGKIIEVIRGKSHEEEKFVYRDAYDPAKDNWSLNFEEISDLIVEGDKVKISFSSKRIKLTRTYTLPYRKEEKAILSDEEQHAFLKLYEQTKKKLLQMHTKEQAMMSDYVPYQSTLATGKLIPYRKPEIIEEMVDERHGIGYVVIKAQIDHHAGRGMQFEWVKYRIEKDGHFSMEDRDCAYELELKQGKQPKVRI